jgi:UDP-glucose 4-epimerase
MKDTEFENIFRGKKVLITGGLGFIGSNLARALVESGAQVHLVDSLDPDCGGNRFNIFGIEDRVYVSILDIRDTDSLSELVARQDFLFNLAGRTSHLGSLQDPLSDQEVNSTAHLSLLQACLTVNPGVRIVYASTRQVYGRPASLPVDETHPPAPVDFNGVSKLSAEYHHKIFHDVYGLRTTCLRMTNSYGPGMRVRDAHQSFIGWWFRLALEGQELPVYADGSQLRDFTFVEDVVDALLLSAVHPAAEGQIYNLGGETPIHLLDLARLIVELAGSGSYRIVPYPVERKKIDIGSFYSKYDRIRADLGWSPKIKLHAGIAATLAFYRQNRDRYW